LSASEPIWRAEKYIYKARPEVKKATLDQDRAALGKAYQAYHGVWIQTGYASLSDVDSGRLLATVWTDYRIEKPKSKFDFGEAKIISLANAYGGVRVKTTPKGASVLVDGVKWDGLTLLTGFTKAGSRRIRIELTGFQADEETVVVTAGTVIEIERTLIKVH